MTASWGSWYFAMRLPTRSMRLLAGVYLVGVSSSSKRSMTAADPRSAHVTVDTGAPGFSVSTTEDAVTSSSVCGACRSKVVTAVPQ